MRRSARFWLPAAAVLAMILGCQNLLDTEEPESEPRDNTPPAEVENLQATTGDGTVRITWSDPEDEDFDHAEVFSNPCYADCRDVVAPGDEQYTFTSLPNDEEFDFYVNTIDTAGNESSGVFVTATPSRAVVTELSATELNGELALSWRDPAATVVEHLEIIWTPEDGESQPKRVDRGVETAGISGLTNETSYDVSVRSFDGEGHFLDTATITAVPDGTAPFNVFNLFAAGNDGRIVLMWDDSEELSHAKILWKPIGGIEQEREVAAGSETASFTELTNGTTYEFTVHAVDQAGNESPGLTVRTAPLPNWTYPVPAEVESSPALEEGLLVYFGGLDNNVYAVDLNGSPAWTYELGGPVQSSPTVGPQGGIYVGANDGILHCLNDSGGNNWPDHALATGGYVLSTPAVGTNDVIYAASADGKLYAVHPNSTLGWTFDTGRSILFTGPSIASDGTIYIASEESSGDYSSSGYLHAVNPTDGSQKWEISVGGAVRSSPAIAADGTVYVCSSDGTLYAVDPTDGTILWTYSTGSTIRRSGPVVGTDGTIYFGAWDEKLYAVASDGNLKWTFPVGGPVESTPAIGANGTVFVGSTASMVFAVNPDGTEKWSFRVQAPIRTAPVISTDGTLYVTTTYNGGYYYEIGAGDTEPVSSVTSPLYAIQTTCGGLASSPWPMMGHGPLHRGQASN